MVLTVLVLLLAAVGTCARESSIGYLFDICAEDDACRQMYHIQPGSTERLFEFLLRLRTGNNVSPAQTWNAILAKHYGTASLPLDTLARHWLHLMRSLTPHCMPCSDAIGTDAGVECVGVDRRLVFDGATQRYTCSVNTTRISRSIEESATTEHHVSQLTVAACVSLASVIALAFCTNIVSKVLLIRTIMADKK